MARKVTLIPVLDVQMEMCSFLRNAEDAAK